MMNYDESGTPTGLVMAVYLKEKPEGNRHEETLGHKEFEESGHAFLSKCVMMVAIITIAVHHYLHLT